LRFAWELRLQLEHMDVYPADLILAVATASATIFLGALPTKNIRSPFFARETLKAAFAWGLVAILSPAAILHFPVIFAILCLAAWKSFRSESALSGKLWLGLASGLGISIGVVFILAVTPQTYPTEASLAEQTLLLASIYLGGAIIGLAYVCYALAQSSKINPGITASIVQRYTGLLLTLVLARGVVMLGSSVLSLDFGLRPLSPGLDLEYLLVFLAVIILPIFAFFARRSVRFSSRAQPTRLLVAICLVGAAAEFLARLLKV